MKLANFPFFVNSQENVFILLKLWCLPCSPVQVLTFIIIVVVTIVLFFSRVRNGSLYFHLLVECHTDVCFSTYPLLKDVACETQVLIPAICYDLIEFLLCGCYLVLGLSSAPSAFSLSFAKGFSSMLHQLQHEFGICQHSKLPIHVIAIRPNINAMCTVQQCVQPQ